MERSQLKKEKSWSNIEYVADLRKGIRPDSLSTLYYHIFFIGRRVLLIGTAMFMNFESAPVYQVLLFLLATMATMIYQASVQPFETNFENALDLYNEFWVLWIAQHHLVMLAYYFDVNQYKLFGSSIIASVLILVISDLLILFGGVASSIKEQLTKCKRHCSR